MTRWITMPQQQQRGCQFSPGEGDGKAQARRSDGVRDHSAYGARHAAEEGDHMRNPQLHLDRQQDEHVRTHPLH